MDAFEGSSRYDNTGTVVWFSYRDLGSLGVCLTVRIHVFLWICRGVSSAWPWFTQWVVKSSQFFCLANKL